MATSKVDVWNMALDRIGQSEAVESETEDTPAAGVCVRHWPRIVREALETYQWHWATRQRVLTEISEQVATYAGDGAADTFQAPVAFLDSTQVGVTLTAGGTTTTLTAGTDYTVTAPADGLPGSVTATTPPAIGETLTVTVTFERAGWAYVYGLPSDFVSPVGFAANGVRFDVIRAESRAPFAVTPNDAGDGLVLVTDVGPTDFDAFEYVAALDSISVMPSRFVDALAWRLAA